MAWESRLHMAPIRAAELGQPRDGLPECLTSSDEDIRPFWWLDAVPEMPLDTKGNIGDKELAWLLHNVSEIGMAALTR